MLAFLLLPFALISLLLSDKDGGGGDDQGGGDGSDADAGGNGGGDKNGKGDEKPPAFTPIESQDALDAVLRDRLARQERKLKADIAKHVRADMEAEAKAAKAKVDNDYKALYEAETAKRETAERERDEERRTALRARIAAKHRLPDDLAARLVGETEDDLDADAKALAKHLKPREAPDTEAGAGKTGGNGVSRSPISPTAGGGDTKPTYAFIPAGAVTIPPGQ